MVSRHYVRGQTSVETAHASLDTLEGGKHLQPATTLIVPHIV